MIMNKCQHEKVYASYILTSNPPQYPWICKKCGLRGFDMGILTYDEYGEIIKQFELRPPDDDLVTPSARGG